MKPTDTLKQNPWLILAVLALLGMMLVPGQAHSESFHKVPRIPVLRLPPSARKLVPRLRLPPPLVARKNRVHWVGSRILRDAAPASAAPEASKTQESLYAKTQETLGTKKDGKVPSLPELKKAFDNAAVRSSTRLTLPENDLEAELGL